MASILNRMSPTAIMPSLAQSLPLSEVASQPKIMSQRSFRRMLHMEQKRADRTKGRFGLLVLAFSQTERDQSCEQVLTKVQEALLSFARCTDVIGWYKAPSMIGVIFTELGAVDETSVKKALQAKIAKALNPTLSSSQIDVLKAFLGVFPGSSVDKFSEEGLTLAQYRDVIKDERSKSVLPLKRISDLTAVK